MARIAALRIPSATEPAHRSEPVHHLWPRWAPVGIAASLLIGIAGASFLFFSGDRGDPSVARNQNRPPPATRDGAADPRWADWLPAATARLPSAPMPSERVIDGAVIPPPAIASDTAVAVAPEPRTPDRDLIGAHPRAEFPNFDLVQLRLPFLEPLADFERDAVRQQLVDELGRDPAFRVDLFARNTARGVELFQNAARASGLAILADSTSMNYLRKGQVGSVVVYTDSLTAAELTALLATLNSVDAKVSPRVFDSVHASPITREDEVEIRRILGTDPGLFKRAIPAPRSQGGPEGWVRERGHCRSDSQLDQIGEGQGGGGFGDSHDVGPNAGPYAAGRIRGVENLSW